MTATDPINVPDLGGPQGLEPAHHHGSAGFCTDHGRLTAVIDAAHLARQREFSERAFGPGARLLGVLDHIRKELAEIEADPADLGEWVDVLILAFDGAWRAGHEPQAIIDAIRAKQARNEARTWPDWRTASPDKAIEHVRPDKQPYNPALDPHLCTVCGDEIAYCGGPKDPYGYHRARGLTVTDTPTEGARGLRPLPRERYDAVLDSGPPAPTEGGVDRG